MVSANLFSIINLIFNLHHVMYVMQLTQKQLELRLLVSSNIYGSLQRRCFAVAEPIAQRKRHRSAVPPPKPDFDNSTNVHGRSLSWGGTFLRRDIETENSFTVVRKMKIALRYNVLTSAG